MPRAGKMQVNPSYGVGKTRNVAAKGTAAGYSMASPAA
jgi:hypothetical protein